MKGQVSVATSQHCCGVGAATDNTQMKGCNSRSNKTLFKRRGEDWIWLVGYSLQTPDLEESPPAELFRTLRMTDPKFSLQDQWWRSRLYGQYLFWGDSFSSGEVSVDPFSILAGSPTCVSTLYSPSYLTHPVVSGFSVHQTDPQGRKALLGSTCCFHWSTGDQVPLQSSQTASSQNSWQLHNWLCMPVGANSGTLLHPRNKF